MEKQCVCLCFLLLLFLVATEALTGGWKPIKDLKDPHVKEIAEFAVKEYNRKSKVELKLESVVKGEKQVVAGFNYRLVLAVKEGEATNNYEAVVWEKTQKDDLQLISFKHYKNPN